MVIIITSQRLGEVILTVPWAIVRSCTAVPEPG